MKHTPLNIQECEFAYYWIERSRFDHSAVPSMPRIRGIVDDGSLREILSGLEAQRAQMIAQDLSPAARSGSGIDPKESDAKSRLFYHVSGQNANAFPHRHPWLVERDFGMRRAATSVSKAPQPQLASSGQADELAAATVTFEVTQPKTGSVQVKMT